MLPMLPVVSVIWSSCVWCATPDSYQPRAADSTRRDSYTPFSSAQRCPERSEVNSSLHHQTVPGTEVLERADVPSRRGRGLGLVTLGEVMALFLAESGTALSHADRFDLSYAGAEATVAVGVARLGMPATFLGRVGNDPLGARIVTGLRGEGVDTGGVVVDPDRGTGVLIRDAPPGRPVTVIYHRAGSAGSALAPEDLDHSRIRSAAVLHVTGITPMLSDTAAACVDQAVAIARAAGVPVVFDPNVRRRLGDPQGWRHTVDRLARGADVVLVGDEDLAALDLGDPVPWFRDRGARIVVVKRGAAGAEEVGDAGLRRVRAHAVPVVDPVGAGDAFAAGWISAWCAGADAAARLQRAVVVAAAVVATRGDVPGLPDGATAAAMATAAAGAVTR